MSKKQENSEKNEIAESRIARRIRNNENRYNYQTDPNLRRDIVDGIMARTGQMLGTGLGNAFVSKPEIPGRKYSVLARFNQKD